MNEIVYDIECYPNFFCVCVLDIDTNVSKEFVIYKDLKDDRSQLIGFLNTLMIGSTALIGYNCNAYDNVLLHKIFNNKSWFISQDIEAVLKRLHQWSCDIINSDYSGVKESENLFYQHDLFKIWHFDNPARSTSLKRLEFYMMWPDLQDLPYDPMLPVDKNQALKLVEYCHNDVLATRGFYDITKENNRFALRQSLSNEYGLDLHNANDVKIGSELFAKFLSEDMGISVYELKELRTYRKYVDLKQCMLPITYKNDCFTKVYEYLQGKRVTKTKGVFKNLSAIYGGVRFDYGTGGLHACIEPGVYEENDEYIIIDVDVASYYPNLAINNNFRPAHLGESFSRIYKNMYHQRKKIPKKDPRNLALKLALNGSFGKMGDPTSFLYDLNCLLAITVNGQLLLSKLVEMIYEATTNCKILQVNTDGATFRILRSEEHVLQQKCKEWEELTKLELESAYYSKMIIRDVNNYMAVYTNGKVKYKGAFEINKEIHKDHSQRVVAIAIARYFISGIDPEETINNHMKKEVYPDLVDYSLNTPAPFENHGLFDFCKMVRSRNAGKKGRANFVYETIDQAGKLQSEALQKVNRYVMSKHGGRIIKVYKDQSRSQVEATKSAMTVLNKINLNHTDIDCKYYVKQARKIIAAVEGNGQKTLF